MNRLLKCFVMLAMFSFLLVEKSFAAVLFPEVIKKNDIVVNQNIPLETQTLYSPIPVKGSDGKFYLLYEIHLTYVPILNQNKITLKQVEVLDKNNNKTLATYTGKDLALIIRQLGKANDAKDRDVMRPGSRIVIYPFVVFASKQDIPRQLVHRITVAEESGKKLAQIETDVVNVENKSAVVVDAPLAGANWYVSDGLGVENHHRNDVVTIGGYTRIPQRFAVDWLKVDSAGSPYKEGSDPNKNSSYYGYGEKIYSVADGVVTFTEDKLPDNSPVGSVLAKAQSIEQAAGNVVGVDIGNNMYVFYCHLQPHTMTVKLGDKVKRGQVIGLLGNSGFSRAPHLHLHIVDKNNVLGGEGVPYVFNTFEIQMTPEQVAKALEEMKKHKAISIPGQGTVHHDELPLMDSVVRFSDK